MRDVGDFTSDPLRAAPLHPYRLWRRISLRPSPRCGIILGVARNEHILGMAPNERSLGDRIAVPRAGSASNELIRV